MVSSERRESWTEGHHSASVSLTVTNGDDGHNSSWECFEVQSRYGL